MLDLHLLPIIQPRALQLPIVDREAQRSHQMQGRIRGQAQPSDVPSVRRNLWLDQDDVEHLLPRTRASYFNLLATNFSSFTISAENLRMPSDVFSVAIALSLNA